MGDLAYADEAIQLRKIAPLSVADIARATGSSTSAVTAWLRRTRGPTGVRAARVAELSAIVEAAAQVIHAEQIPLWLNKPVPMLNGAKPIDLIARGDYEPVLDVIAGLAASDFS